MLVLAFSFFRVEGVRSFSRAVSANNGAEIMAALPFGRLVVCGPFSRQRMALPSVLVSCVSMDLTIRLPLERFGRMAGTYVRDWLIGGRFSLFVSDLSLSLSRCSVCGV